MVFMLQGNNTKEIDKELEKVFTIYSESFRTPKNATLSSKVIIRRQLEAVYHPATESPSQSAIF